jgi:hypothetical protein
MFPNLDRFSWTKPDLFCPGGTRFIDFDCGFAPYCYLNPNPHRFTGFIYDGVTMTLSWRPPLGIETSAFIWVSLEVTALNLYQGTSLRKRYDD